MTNLINSSNLLEALVERIYRERFATKNFNLLDVQALWTNALVHFGNDADRAMLMAVLATATLSPADIAVVMAQVARDKWANFENLTGTEIWPKPVSEVDEEIDLDTLKADLTAKIDRLAETARLAYITNGSGQAMVYQQKYAEAQIVTSTPEVVLDIALVPHIAAEAAVNGITLYDQAVIVMEAFAQWQTVSAVIEAKRMLAKKAIVSAATADDAYLAANVNWVAAA